MTFSSFWVTVEKSIQTPSHTLCQSASSSCWISHLSATGEQAAEEHLAWILSTVSHVWVTHRSQHIHPGSWYCARQRTPEAGLCEVREGPTCLLERRTLTAWVTPPAEGWRGLIGCSGALSGHDVGQALQTSSSPCNNNYSHCLSCWYTQTHHHTHTHTHTHTHRHTHTHTQTHMHTYLLIPE